MESADQAGIKKTTAPKARSCFFGWRYLFGKVSLFGGKEMGVKAERHARILRGLAPK